MPAGRPWEYFDPSYRANTRSQAAGREPFRRTLPSIPERPPEPPKQPGPSGADTASGVIGALGNLVGGGLTLAGMAPLGLGIMAGGQGLAAIPQIVEGDVLQGASMLGNAAAGTAAQRLAKHLHQPPAGTVFQPGSGVRPGFSLDPGLAADMGFVNKYGMAPPWTWPGTR